MVVVARVIGMIFSALYFLLLGRVICSFFISPYQSGRPIDRIYGIIYIMTEPFLSPIRNFLRRFQTESSTFAAVDFSPLVALIILQILHRLVLMGILS